MLHVINGDKRWNSEQEAIKEGYTEKTVNGHTFYELTASDTPETLRRAAIFLNNDTRYYIAVSGKKDEVNKGFNMIINSFKMK